MKIIEKPYDLSELRDLSKDGRERVAGVVAVAWHGLLGRDRDQFEEQLARRVTGTRYGLADLGIRLVGCLGQDMLLEASGDVSMLLGDYEAIMAEEAADGGDRGVPVATTRPTPGLGTGPPAVTDPASAEAFVRWCVRRVGTGYHPDTPAADYVEAGTARPSFTPDEARLLDGLHERAFALLGDGGPYRVALEEAGASGQAEEEDRQPRREAEGGEHAT